MKNILQSITDRVSTKKGMWFTLIFWLAAMILLTIFAPSVRDYQVTSVDTLPDDAQSIIASKKVEEYFGSSDLIPAILVFESDDEVELQDLVKITNQVIDQDISGVEEVIPLGNIPPQATDSFFSDDRKTAFLPLNLQSSLDTPDIKEALSSIYDIVEEESNLTLYITGPAGIAVDTSDLFSRADLVLIFSTIAIILVLLVVIYRSPLLALIPLLGAVFVYQIVTQILGILGKSGLLMSQQTVSIMSILLFAAVIDYSLFVFSRFREELKNHENKYDAMKKAMRGTGLPVFYSGATVLAAMLILFVATLGDYKNFAPTFGVTLVVIIVASVTLIPALFAMFGRKSFWPIIPRVGDHKVKESSFWSKVGRFVTKKPILSVVLVGLFIVLSSSNILNIKYEFDLIKSFPEDMPSRVGYEILEKNFDAGDLAPTTILLKTEDSVSEEAQQALKEELTNKDLVSDVRIDGVNEDETAIRYSLTFEKSPYSVEVLDELEMIQNQSEQLIDTIETSGELYFAGETASSIDERAANNRDLLLIVSLETILIFIMLIFLTKSFKMPLYMMGTILVSFGAALGLGMFLTNLFFDIDSISNRVPVYAFIFLVALGIDYNIILVSRFMEERKTKSVKEAVEHSVASTGGVISSAGIILASTFAVLMTQPIQLLFVFGFIVAVGILIDTFLIRGVLLPGLLTWFEKDDRQELPHKSVD
ncbi:MMPL family transporter [Ornithinibacillus halophilus]|uniref:Putative drug exporter of the RND superfamily n=1 Tax=Ornithinibacillus halophilus TaxID=930117 RepID=A0A1M5DV87_9BACI|nr:MMPL family transporter [Ornithinibacillus halophilus]SHF70732.1 putative drug exporter of the RND superfamily [Ornithinibacillus halophilus]